MWATSTRSPNEMHNDMVIEVISLTWLYWLYLDFAHYLLVECNYFRFLHEFKCMVMYGLDRK